MVISTKRKYNKKDNTKLAPLPFYTRELFCAPVMFACFVCSLLSFCAREFPENPKPENPRTQGNYCGMHLVCLVIRT